VFIQGDFAPNVASATTSPTPITKTKSGKRKRNDRLEKQVVVHEFCNTTKHSSFLREDSGRKETKIVSEFVDGKGWVDEEGNLVEDIVKTKGNRRKHMIERAVTDAVDEAQRSASGTTSSDISEELPKRSVRTQDADQNVNDVTSFSGTSSDSELSKENHESVQSVGRDEKIAKDASSISDAENIVSDIHPLEAIFKRPKHKPSNGTPKPSSRSPPHSTSLSLMPKMTQRVHLLYLRHLLLDKTSSSEDRSAAPTPDTAAPGKTFSYAWPEADEEPDYGADED
jgi:uncharacterized protein YdaT